MNWIPYWIFEMIEMKKWRYIPFETNNGPKNMAIDEMLLERVIKGESPNLLRFYKWNPSTATIGLHQSLNAEINLNSAKQNNVDIVRRITGGGAVLHDSTGEITYSVICKLKDIPELKNSPREYDSSIPLRYQVILESLASGLEEMGVSIDVGKIHCPALLTQGKKISGNAQTIRNGTLLQHGTILLSVEPEFMYQILKAPVGVTYTKMVQSVRSKVIGICQNNENNTDINNLSEREIVDKLKAGFQHIFGIEFQTEPLTKKENLEAENLAKNKYASKKWLEKYL
ncbi:lipoate--protein ligase family protein [Candidatus Lokiarchaeum ossiferum]